MVLSPSPYHDAFPYRSSHSLYLPTSFVLFRLALRGARGEGYHCNTYARARAAPSIPIGPQNQFSLSAAATQQVQQYFCFPPFCFLFSIFFFRHSTCFFSLVFLVLLCTNWESIRVFTIAQRRRAPNAMGLFSKFTYTYNTMWAKWVSYLLP